MSMYKNRLLTLSAVCTIPFLTQADPKTTKSPLAKRDITLIHQNVALNNKTYEFQNIATGNPALDAHIKRVQDALKSDYQQAKNMSDEELKKLYNTSSRSEALKLAKKRFAQRGPSLMETLPMRYFSQLKKEAEKQGGSRAVEDLEKLFNCVHAENSNNDYDSFGTLKAYPTLNDSGLLGLEKFGMDYEDETNQKIYIPALQNLHELPGYKPGAKFDDIAVGVYKAVINQQVINLSLNATSPIALLKNAKQIDLNEMPALFKTTKDADIFFRPGLGYNMSYAIRLVSQLITLKQAGLFDELLSYAPKWEKTIVGNEQQAAAVLLKKQLGRNPDILCLQEMNNEYIKQLEQSGHCLPMNDQPGNHCRTCYNKTVFSSSKTIPLSPWYPKYDTDHGSLLTEATRIGESETGPKTLVGNIHASSRTKQDRFDAINACDKGAEQCHQETNRPVRLYIAIDANTVDKQEQKELLEHCIANGFKITCVDTNQEDKSTVCKERASLCAQPHKGEKKDKATKDYIMVKEYGCTGTHTKSLAIIPDANINMPNAEFPADHKMLEATFELH